MLIKNRINVAHSHVERLLLDLIADKIDKLHCGMIAEMNAILFPYPGARDKVAEQLDALIESPHHKPTDTRHTPHTHRRSG